MPSASRSRKLPPRSGQKLVYRGPWAQGEKAADVQTPKEAAPQLAEELTAIYSPGQLQRICNVLPEFLLVLPARAMLEPDFPEMFAEMCAQGKVSARVLALLRGRCHHDETAEMRELRLMDMSLWGRIQAAMTYSVRQWLGWLLTTQRVDGAADCRVCLRAHA